MNCIETIG